MNTTNETQKLTPLHKREHPRFSGTFIEYEREFYMRGCLVWGEANKYRITVYPGKILEVELQEGSLSWSYESLGRFPFKNARNKAREIIEQYEEDPDSFYDDDDDDELTDIDINIRQ